MRFSSHFLAIIACAKTGSKTMELNGQKRLNRAEELSIYAKEKECKCPNMIAE